MNDELVKRLKELYAKATPGPWYHVQAFQTVPAERTVHGPVPAQRVDFVSTCPEPVHKRVVIPMEGSENTVRSVDMAFIVELVNAFPELAATIERQAEEIKRKDEALRKIKLHIVDTLCTHSRDVADWDDDMMNIQRYVDAAQVMTNPPKVSEPDIAGLIERVREKNEIFEATYERTTAPDSRDQLQDEATGQMNKDSSGQKP